MNYIKAMKNWYELVKFIKYHRTKKDWTCSFKILTTGDEIIIVSGNDSNKENFKSEQIRFRWIHF